VAGTYSYSSSTVWILACICRDICACTVYLYIVL